MSVTDPAAPGTPGGEPPGDGSAGADAAAENERLRAENERLTNNNRQLLAEKTNTEEVRRRAEEMLRNGGGNQPDHVRELIRDMESDDTDTRSAATAQMVKLLGTELRGAYRQVDVLKQIVTTPIPEDVPKPIRQAALKRLEEGRADTLEEAIDVEVGAAVRAGTYTPPTKKPDPDPAAPTPKPPAPRAPAAPAGTPPLATVTRSRPDVAAGLPPTMTETEYTRLPPEQRRAAYLARRDRTLTVTPG